MSNALTFRDIPLSAITSPRELLISKAALTQVSAVLPKHMDGVRLMRGLASSLQRVPKLQQCDPFSLLGAVMQVGSLGLEPNTPLGHAYILPFDVRRKVGREWQVVRTDAQVIIGYKGFINLAMRSQMVSAIHADVVYSDDELWSYEYGSQQHLRHKPGPQSGSKVAAYCYIRLTHGEGFVVMPAEQILAIRNRSQGYISAVRLNRTDSPWQTDEDAMWRKTPVRAIANRGELPMNTEFARAAEIDDVRRDYAQFALADVGPDDMAPPIAHEPEPEPEPEPEQHRQNIKTKPEPEPEQPPPADDPLTIPDNLRRHKAPPVQPPQILDSMPPLVNEENEYSAPTLERYLFDELQPWIEDERDAVAPAIEDVISKISQFADANPEWASTDAILGDGWPDAVRSFINQ